MAPKKATTPAKAAPKKKASPKKAPTKKVAAKTSEKPAATKKTAKPKAEAAPKSQPAEKKATAKPKKVSALDAAAAVLADAKQPMNCKEMIEAMAAKGLWSSPGGKTPHATLSSAILREVTKKGAESRFTKVGPGKFAANG